MQSGHHRAGMRFLHVLPTREVNQSGESARFVCVPPQTAQCSTQGHCGGIPKESVRSVCLDLIQ